MAETGRYRILQLLRGADQQTSACSIPRRAHPRLAENTSTTQPAGYRHLGTNAGDRPYLASPAAYPPPLAQSALRRHSPKVGAVCGKAARTVLCGGRSVMGVPTSTSPAPCPRTFLVVP